MSSPDFKVLAHGVVLLLVQMCFDERVELIVSAPEPVQRVFAKGCDVGYMEARSFLCESGLLAWNPGSQGGGASRKSPPW